MKTRYRKVIGDLASDYPKQFMLVLAIAIGIFGIGSILGGYHVIKRAMRDNYMGTVPASATIELEKDIPRALADSISRLPGIQAAERHATRIARMKVGDRWYPLLLFVIDDFGSKRTNKFTPLSGQASPSLGTILVERTALMVMNAKEGDAITVKMPHGTPRIMKISGTVHDPGLAPAWQEQAGYGYISMETLQLLGESRQFDQLRILVSGQPESRQHITAKARQVAAWLAQRNYAVHEIKVPSPGKHPHQSQMTTVMTLFVIFSFLVLALGAIVVATAMATLMVKQVRQIGVMKAIGASAAQIAGIYGLMVVVLCLVALLIAIPVSRLAAAAFASQLAVLLNLEITDPSIPMEVVLIQIAAGIIIPVITSGIPVIRGSRISVRKALDNYGVAQSDGGQPGWITRLSQRMVHSQIAQLSIRNVFRQRSRLVMTLGLLAAGGAMFMTARNVSTAWNENLKRIYQQRLYDLDVRLDSAVYADTLLQKLRSIPGVTQAEGWNYSPASFKKDSAIDVTHTYPDGGHGSFGIVALPVPTRLLNPTVTEGRWLTPGQTNDVVLNQLARSMAPSHVGVGDHIYLSTDGVVAEWTIVGFTEDVGSPATAYVSREAFIKQKGSSGRVNILRVAYHDRSKDNAISRNRDIETLLENEKIFVSALVPVWMLHNAIAAHMKVLVNSLMALALLMAVVGAIGLMSAMSMNVLERTREIGVMRAIGATPAMIRNLIVWEALLVGVFSIAIAFALSLVLSAYMGRTIGSMAFRTPLPLAISPEALGIWILIILAGSFLATLYPVRRANAITTREALAYE